MGEGRNNATDETDPFPTTAPLAAAAAGVAAMATHKTLYPTRFLDIKESYFQSWKWLAKLYISPLHL